MDKQKLKNTGLHLLIWIILILTNILIISNFGASIDYGYMAISWSLFALVFYLNYFWLMPSFLLKKKVLAYILLILAMLAVSISIKTKTDFVHFTKIREEMKDGPPARYNHDTIENEDRSKTKPPGFPDKHNRPPEGIFSMRSIPSVFGVLLILFASIAIRFMRKWKEDEKLKLESDKERIFAELSYLRQQVNPHFLFNALNSIYSLSLTKSDHAAESIQKLSSILRYMIYKTDNKKVALSDELEIIDNYIQLQKLRLTDKVLVRFEIKGDAEKNLIEPLLMLPLIENAFKFGADNVTQSLIDISIDIANSNLRFSARNNIVVHPDEHKGSNGLGLENLKKRLELLYKGHYNLEIEDDKKFFAVNLTLKL